MKKFQNNIKILWGRIYEYNNIYLKKYLYILKIKKIIILIVYSKNNNKLIIEVILIMVLIVIIF